MCSGWDRPGWSPSSNDGARQLLDLPADAVGRDVGDLGLEPDLLDVIRGTRTGIDLVVVHGDRVLVVNRRTARTGGRSGVSSGTVTTLRDRSELIAVQRQLGATRNATDTLRAQTHEFDNQLHVISGLLQLRRVRRGAGATWPGLTRRRAEVDSAVTARIEDPPLAALLVAKSSLAAESRVELEISPATRCPRLPAELSTDVATVVGNLVDNALDAVANLADASITVEVTADDTDVHVTVSDSGPGVSPDAAQPDLRSGLQHQIRGGRGRSGDRAFPGPPDLRAARRGGRSAVRRRRGLHRRAAGASRRRPTRSVPIRRRRPSTRPEFRQCHREQGMR